MHPEVFFGSEALGRGVLVRRNGSIARGFEVKSTGRESARGDFVLDQTIRFDDGEVQTRRWTLTKTSAHRYRGTLTDASGPVRATTDHSVLSLSYRLAGVPLARVQQVLYLQPGGQTIINEGTVRILGIRVRRLHEVIEIAEPADQLRAVD